MSFYFDTVLNGRMKPVFDGEPAAVRRFLKNNGSVKDFKVLVGALSQVVSAEDYIATGSPDSNKADK
jgi:hypothetical protein